MIRFIGPLPPPVHGQALATKRILDRLADRGMRVDVIDTAGNLARRFASHLLAAVRLVTSTGPCYISLNSNSGLWLSAGLVGVARIMGRRTFVHHHSFAVANSRLPACVALVALGGRALTHIALSPVMADRLRVLYSGLNKCRVVGNAGLVEDFLHTSKRREGPLRIGFLGNLTLAKGFDTAAEVALQLNAEGAQFEFWVAGPAVEQEAQNILELLQLQLGARFKYAGPVSGDTKSGFYEGLDLLLFPTRYKNEAAPLVVLEAMAAGIPVVATAVGCIPEMLGMTGGFVTADILAGARTCIGEGTEERSRRRRAARERFLELKRQDDIALEGLLAEMSQE